MNVLLVFKDLGSFMIQVKWVAEVTIANITVSLEFMSDLQKSYITEKVKKIIVSKE